MSLLWQGRTDADHADSIDLERFAIDYWQRYGWSIIPMKTKDLPGVKWGPFQRHRLDEKRLRGKFPSHRITGLAVIPGRVSNGLMVRDYDTEDAYEGWAALQPDLAATLPMVATARGYHVYFRGKPFDFRAATGKDDLTCVAYTDGELRAGRGYVVLPPSLHPSGIRYRWVKPPREEIPWSPAWQMPGSWDAPSRNWNRTDLRVPKIVRKWCVWVCVGGEI